MTLDYNFSKGTTACFSLLLNTLLAFAKVENFVRLHRPIVALGLIALSIAVLQLGVEERSLLGLGQSATGNFCANNAMASCATCNCDPQNEDCYEDQDECHSATHGMGGCMLYGLDPCPYEWGSVDVCYLPWGTACTDNTDCSNSGTCGGAGSCNCGVKGWYDGGTDAGCIFSANCESDGLYTCYNKKSECENGLAGGSNNESYKCSLGTCVGATCTPDDISCFSESTCDSTCGGPGGGGTYQCSSGACAPMACDIIDADCFGSDSCGLGCEQPKWCCDSSGCTQLATTSESCGDGSSGHDSKGACESAELACRPSSDEQHQCNNGQCTPVDCNMSDSNCYVNEATCDQSCGGGGDNCGGVTAQCIDTTVGVGQTCGPTSECCTSGGEKGMSGTVCGTGLTCEGDNVSGACVADSAVCGNGSIESGEDCDDSNTIDTDACTAACKDAECGDGIVQSGTEECDDGNDIDADDCKNDCKEQSFVKVVTSSEPASSVAVSSAISSEAASSVAVSEAASSEAVSEAASSVAVSEAASSVAVSEAASSVAVSEAASSVAVSEAASSEAVSEAASSEAASVAASSTQGTPPICGNGEIDSGEECDGSLRSASCEPRDMCNDQCQCEWGDAVLCGNDPSICCNEGAKQYCCRDVEGQNFHNETVCWDSASTPPPASCDAIDPAFTCATCNADRDCRDAEMCFDGMCSLYTYADEWVKTGNPSEFSTAVGHSLVVTETGSTRAFWNVFQEVGPVFSNTNVASGDGENWTEESGVFIGTPSIAEFTHLVFNDLQWMIGGTDYSRAPRRTRDVWNSEDGIVWSKYPNALPHAVDRHASVVFNNKMWVFGGAQGSSDYGDKILVSSTGVSGWTEAGTIPVALSQAEAVVYNNEILLIGGKLQGGSDSEKVWKSSDGVTWAEQGDNVLAGLNFSNRTATVLGNRIVIVGHSLDDTAPVRFSEDGGLTWAPEISPDSFVFGGTDIEALDHTLWLVGGYDEVTDTNASGVHYLATIPQHTCNPTEFENPYFCEYEPPASSSSSAAVESSEVAASESFSEAPPPPPPPPPNSSAAGSTGGSGGGSTGGPTRGQGPERIVCGDGRVQGREACDDGNNRNRDGCSSGCEIESARGSTPGTTPAFQPIPVGRNTTCGNGLVEGGEECDDGNTRNGDGCSDRCAQEPRLLVPADAVCGNGITEDREACDLGSGNSDVNPDTCRTNCQYPRCGDFVFDDGEECDNGPANSDSKANACRNSCTLPSCGDSVIDTDETCDDGNTESGDGCSAICQEEEETLFAAATVCGDGILAASEECDDGNRRDVDGCSSTCLLEVGLCGDGIVQSLMGEHCESSLHDPLLPFGCAECLYVSFTCGDSVVDAGEECDDGPNNSNEPNALCRPQCHLARCGDGIIDTQEECDDGNRIHNDDCDSACKDTTEVLGVAIEEEPTKPDVIINTPKTPQVVPPVPSTPIQTAFPTLPNRQPLPYQLPLAQLQPLIQSQGPVGDTGPAAVAVVASGMAAGLGWMRRKRK